MKKTWVAAVKRSGARVFEHVGIHKGFRLLHEIEHPQGVLKNSEIKSDRAGQSMSAYGSQHHAMANEQSAREHVLEKFAHTLAEYLEDHAVKGDFEGLVIAAEPHCLGHVRAALRKNCERKVVGSVSKDLFDVAPQDLGQRLSAETGLVF